MTILILRMREVSQGQLVFPLLCPASCQRDQFAQIAIAFAIHHQCDQGQAITLFRMNAKLTANDQ